MLKKEDNVLITHIGPGTKMGKVFRSYWIPAVLAVEVPEADCPPVRVRLLGEDLIAFRNTDGKVGLVDAYCPHRRAPMFFGRNEDCGLRCVYHGWKFDIDGNCTDMPNEPVESNFKHKIKIKSYPCWEGGGIVWTYMGSADEQPPVPNFEWLRAPATHCFVNKTYEHCNYLQALEGGIDTSHSSFTHNNDLQNKESLRTRATSPKLEVEKTPYGFQYVGIRDFKDGTKYVRLYQFIMPFQQFRGHLIESSKKHADEDFVPTIDGHIWVPIDDETTYVYNWMYSTDVTKPLTPEFQLKKNKHFGRGMDDFLPGYPYFRLKKNQSNDYMIDRELQRTKTYTGIVGLNTQDYALQEGMGPIVDRSEEHLGTTDIAIIAARQLLLEAAKRVETGKQLRGTNPKDYEKIRAADSVIAANESWQEQFENKKVALW
jgi:phthalate 4,5-dioxygenase oxygenase subunit